MGRAHQLEPLAALASSVAWADSPPHTAPYGQRSARDPWATPCKRGTRNLWTAPDGQLSAREPWKLEALLPSPRVVDTKPPWVAVFSLPSPPQSARSIPGTLMCTESRVQANLHSPLSELSVAPFEPGRPISRNTMTLAKMQESDLMFGRAIWRGAELESEIEEFRQERLELGQYRLECARKVGTASRERARNWRKGQDRKVAQLAAASQFTQKVSHHSSEDSIPDGGWSLRLRQSLGIVHDDHTDNVAEEDPAPGGASKRAISLWHVAGNTAKMISTVKNMERPRRETVKKHQLPQQMMANGNFISPVRRDTQIRHLRKLKPGKTQTKLPSVDDKAKRKTRILKTVKEALLRNAQALMPDASQTYHSHEREWEEMPEESKRAMKQAFSKNDEHGGSGTLDLHRAVQALREVGLTGRVAEEVHAVRALCAEFIATNGEVDFLSFCFAVVPQVQKKLGDMFRDSVRDEFNQESPGGMQGFLPVPAARFMVERLLGNPLMGNDAMAELRDCFNEEVEKLARSKNEETNVNHPRAKYRTYNTFLWEEESPEDMRLNWETFESLLQRTQKRHELLNEQHLAQLREAMPAHLSDKLGCLEADILPLHFSFRRFDTEHEEELSPARIRSLLIDFGFLSGAQSIDQMMLDHLNEAVEGTQGNVDFPLFLQIIHNIREESKSMNQTQNNILFNHYDKDASGTVSAQEASTLFLELGLAPSCQRGQDEIKRLLAASDGDGSGELDREEFHHLVQLVTEKLRSLNRFKELSLGSTLNIQEKTVREYRDFFWEIDTDGNGSLDLQELRTVMRLMQQRIDGDDLRLLMQKIDVDGNGHLDFSEFLQLMALIETLMAEDEFAQAVRAESEQPRPITKRLSRLVADLAHTL